MKKLFALLCAVALLVSLAACASNKEETPAEDTNPVDDMALSDIMNDILDGVAELPQYEVVDLTEENFEFFTFIPYEEGYEAVEADALIGSIAHSVVLVRVPDGADAAQVAADMEANANPAKWICVQAEATHVRQHGNTILLVMSSVDTANTILKNFDALNGDATPESDLAEPVETEEIPEDVMNDPTATPEDDTTPEDDMPTLAPEEGEDGNMPAVDPGDEAVEMPTVKPEQPEDPVTTVPVEPEKPAEKPSQPETKPEEKPEEKPTEPTTDLLATVNTVLSGIEDLPMSMPSELTADNFEFYAAIPYAEGYRGVQADSAIGSIAHSVVIVEVPEGGDPSQVAADMKANADPRKWICVEAESVQTAVNGNLVLLVMSSQATADAIVANFNAL